MRSLSLPRFPLLFPLLSVFLAPPYVFCWYYCVLCVALSFALPYPCHPLPRCLPPCRSILDAKASVALDGMVARPATDTKIASKDPDCFEVCVRILACVRLLQRLLCVSVCELAPSFALQVHHPRRRTYYLRPVKASGVVDAKQSSEYWIKAINAAISSIGFPFAARFKAPRPLGK